MISYAARSYHQQQKSTPADSFRTAQPVSHLNLYVHALPPDSCALGACSFWASSFSRQPIPALPHRTIHNKLRPNLTIKLGTAGSKSSIICRATLKRNSKHHRPHSQFMRQPSLSVIPEQFEESVPSTPALSRTSSSSRLLPSLELVTPVSNVLSSLFTKDEEKKGKLQAWWSWVGWSALQVNRSNKEGMRITIEDLPDVGPGVTVTSSTETLSPGSDLSDQSKADHFFSGFDCDKAPDCDSDSDSERESSRWSGIIPRAVFNDKAWIADSILSQAADGEIVCEQEKSLLDDVPQETKKERNERLKNWMEKSDLVCVPISSWYIVEKLTCRIRLSAGPTNTLSSPCIFLRTILLA